METPEMNRERSWALAAEAASKLSDAPPSETLAEVVTPLSLASYVPPEAFESLREIVRKLEETQGELARVVGKISEVELALQSLDARRPADAAALAEALLAGENLPAPVEAKVTGLAGMGAVQLQAARAGLQAKRRELEGSETFWKSQFRTRASRGASHAGAARGPRARAVDAPRRSRRAAP